MSFLRSKKTSGQIPVYTGLQIQTAISTLPIPLIYGRAKVGVNVIKYWGFLAIREKQSGIGGKGFFGKKGGYQYYANLMLALGEGPIVGVRQTFNGQSVAAFSSFPGSLFLGTDSQTPWSHLVATEPASALAYRKTAYIGAPYYSLGSSASLGNINFEVDGLLFGTGFNSVDADPALVIQDYLSRAKFPASSIDTATLLGTSGDRSLQTYCWAQGLAISPVLNQHEDAASAVENWLTIANFAPVFSEGKLKFRPYGDLPITGNGRTFTPDVTPKYNLTVDDFVVTSSGESPVSVSRVDLSTLPTLISVEVTERGEYLKTNQYQSVPVEARDIAAAQTIGVRPGQSMTLREVCSVEMGAKIAQTILQRKLYTRAAYEFRLSWEYPELEPMDIVTITLESLGLDQTPVMIREMEEDDEGGFINVVAEEFVLGVGTPAENPTDEPGAAPENPGALVTNVEAQIIYEPTADLGNNTLQVWMGASSSDPNWGGAKVWVSVDGGTDYEQVGTLTLSTGMGVLTAPLASATGVDNTNTLSVDMGDSLVELESVSAATAAAGGNLCVIDTELLSFRTATLAGTDLYNLTSLYRGQYTSAPAAHSSGAKFAMLDNVVKMEFNANLIGTTIKVKFQSFNLWGQGEMDISAVTEYSYTLTGRSSVNIPATTAPAQPTELTAVQSSTPGVMNLSAKSPNSANFSYLRFFRTAVGAALNTGVQVGADVAGAANTTLIRTDSVSPGSYDYWAVAYSAYGTPSVAAGPVTATASFETPAIALDFTSGVKPTALTFTCTGHRMHTDMLGYWTYAPNNMLLNSAALGSQSVTTEPIAYILSFKGTGSVVLSGTHSQTVNGTSPTDRVFVKFTPTAGSLTLSVFGSVTEAQLEAVTYQTSPRSYLATTGSARYDMRFEYLAGVCQGAWGEQGVQNALLWTEDFTNAVWTRTNMAVPTSNTYEGPTGEVKMDTLTATGANAEIKQNGGTLALALNSARGFSVYLARKTGTGNVSIELGRTSFVCPLTSVPTRFAVLDSALSATYSRTANVVTVVATAHGFQNGESVRVDVLTGGAADITVASITYVDANTFTYAQTGADIASGTASIYAHTARIRIATSGDEIYAGHAMLEADSRSISTCDISTYIPCFGTSVTRAEEKLEVDGTNFSSVYNPLEGTIFSEVKSTTQYTSADRTVYCIDDGTTGQANQLDVRLNFDTTYRARSRNTSVSTADINPANGMAVLTFHKLAFGFKLNDMGASVNNIATVTDTVCTMPAGTMTRLRLGARGTTVGCDFRGIFRRVFYYNNKKISSQIQLLTTI